MIFSKNNVEAKEERINKSGRNVESDGLLKKLQGVYGYVLPVLIIVAIAFLLEIFVFNYRHWASLGNDAIVVEKPYLGRSVISYGDGTYSIDNSSVVDPLDSYFIVYGWNQKLKTARIEIDVITRSEEDMRTIPISQCIRDEGHNSFYGFPGRELSVKEERSEYMNFHPYGICYDYAVKPNVGNEERFTVKITLNPVIPIFFSFQRLGFVLFLMLLAYVLRPKSVLHKIRYTKLGNIKIHILCASFIVLHMAFFIPLSGVNPHFVDQIGESLVEYQSLAESFAAGKIYILEEPCDTIKNMPNPYDTSERFKQLEEKGGSILWDHAYYNGKYYVYFGVIPVVLFYFPYYMLTGEHLTNQTVILICFALLLIALMLVMDELIRRYYKKCSVGVWFLLSELFVVGTEILYIGKRPETYAVPIASSLAFGMFSFWCFLKATRDKEKLHKVYLVAGSLLVSLIAGCRPQMFLFFVLDLALIGNYLFSWKYLKSKDGILSLVSIGIPMATVAALLMTYNYLRFGSPFDFGANYNLTLNDMRFRGWVWDRVPFALQVYFFEPIGVKMNFPFLDNYNFASNYMGVTIQEITFGGLYYVMPFTLIGFGAIIFRNQLKKYKIPRTVAILGIVCTYIIGIVDAQMAGVLKRYFGDFTVFSVLAAIIVSLLIFKEWNKNTFTKNAMIYILIVCLIYKILFESLNFFQDVAHTINDVKPEMFQHYKYLWMFWL